MWCLLATYPSLILDRDALFADKYMNRIQFLGLSLITSCVLLGCGSDEPNVVLPTETYQPTEIERANAEREAAEREQEPR